MLVSEFLTSANTAKTFRVQIKRLGIDLECQTLEPSEWVGKLVSSSDTIQVAAELLVASETQKVFDNKVLQTQQGVDNSVDCVKASLLPGEILSAYTEICEMSGFNFEKRIDAARKCLDEDSEAQLLRFILERYKKTPFEVYSEPQAARDMLYAMALKTIEEENKAEKRRQADARLAELRRG